MPIISDDKLVVVPATRDAYGKQIDPEERPAHREMAVVTEISLGTAVKEMAHDTKVQIEKPAGEMAQELSQICSSCSHWDNAGWQQEYRKNKNDPQFKKTFDGLRGQILGGNFAGLDPTAVERVMMGLGFCQALGATFGFPFTVHPKGSCPEKTGPLGEDCSKFFKARSRRDEKDSLGVRDSILNAAQGRGVKIS